MRYEVAGCFVSFLLKECHCTSYIVLQWMKMEMIVWTNCQHQQQQHCWSHSHRMKLSRYDIFCDESIFECFRRFGRFLVVLLVYHLLLVCLVCRDYLHLYH